MKYIEGVDFFVHILPFPVDSIGGAVTPNDDGTFSIYINSRVSEERQRKAYRHELGHIVNGDFWNDLPIEEIEGL